MDKYDVQIELLREIDNICKENHIQYILYGECARSACVAHTITGCGPLVEVAMCQGDAEKFARIVEERKPEGRYVEGLINNPRYPHNYLVYGNSNTTDFNIKRNNYVKNKGIAINIYYINKKAKIRKKQLLLEKLWKSFNVKIENRGAWYLRLPLGLINLFMKMIGENRVGCWYYNSLRKLSFIDTWDGIFEYSKVRIKGNAVPTKYFKKLETVSVDGLQLSILEDYRKYLNYISGIGWKRRSFYGTKPQSGEIVSATVGFDRLMSDLHVKKMIQNARSNHEKARFIRALAVFSVWKVNKLWSLVLMTKEQVAFRRNLQEQKEYILSLDNEQDQKELYKLLEPVMLSLDNYSAQKLAYSIDEELDNKIEQFMIFRGEVKKVALIRKLRKRTKFI